MPTETDWTAPTAEEVVDGVYRIPLPMPNDGLRAINVYAIRDGEGRLTLVDSGWSIPRAREVLVDMLGRLGHSLSDIGRFLVTHIHRDHYALAVALRREFGSTVMLGIGEKPSMDVLLSPARAPLEHGLDRLRRLGAGVVMDEMVRQLPRVTPAAEPGEWEEPDVWLTAQTLSLGARSFEVVPTPGHTRGHVVFHDTDEAVLFAGDHVLPTITPSIGLEPELADNPLGDFLASLALVRSRPDAMLLPAHGPVTGSVHAQVDKLVTHHGRRLDHTEAAALAGASTAYEIAGRLRWTRREREFHELDMFNQMLAVRETGAHLDLLVAQQRLAAVEREGILHYAAA